jgi:hypothetical protein
MHDFLAKQVTFQRKPAMQRNSFSATVAFSQYSTQQMRVVWSQSKPRVSFAIFFSYAKDCDYPSNVYVGTLMLRRIDAKSIR